MILSKWQRAGIAAALVAGGVLVGANLSTTNRALAEVTTEPPAFQSGGQQSVPILREISATLHQMDARLARLEIVAQKLKTDATRRPVASTTQGAVQ